MAYTITRDGQVLLSSYHRERDWVDATFDLIADGFSFCKKEAIPLAVKVVSALHKAPDDFVITRRTIFSQFGKRKVYSIMLKEWREAHTFLSAREKFLAKITVPLMALMIFTSIILSFYPPTRGEAMEFNLPEMFWIDGSITPQPVNWVVEGEPTRYGSPEAVMGAFNYATVAGYTFAANEAELLRMVETGTLVELEENEYIEFNEVSQPYVLPIVKEFVNRLAMEYTAIGCGRLIVNGAARDLTLQATLPNGSPNSVHPTGMAVDLRSKAKAETGGTECRSWLKRVLLSIEASRRIDVTIERSPAHFHVVVVPDAYEAFLASRTSELDPVVHWLATAMYFEGDFNESRAGRTAIAWTIANRMRSENYPDSIIGVIADGAAGRRNGGCQFSFVCDGAPENIQKPCNNNPALASLCQAKWEEVVTLAKELLPVIMDPRLDPTNGAVLYYSTSMDGAPPYWARRRVERRADGSRIVLPYGDFDGRPTQIGNHWFGRSIFCNATRLSGGENS